MPRRKYTRPYHEQNKHFQLWMPETLYLWFMDYLQHYGYGGNTSEIFRNFLFELQQLENEGIHFINARTAKEEERKRLLGEKYGVQVETDLICLRNINRANKDPRDRELMCIHCKDAQKAIFKACQEIRAEQKDAELNLHSKRS